MPQACLVLPHMSFPPTSLRARVEEAVEKEEQGCMSSEDSRLAPAVSQPILVDLAKFRARAAAWAVGAHQAAVQDTPAAAPLPPSIRPSPTPIHASATAPPHLLADHIRSGAFELTVAAPPPAPPAGADASPDADASPPLTASPHAPPPPNATSPPLTRDHFVKRGVAILCQLDD